MDLSVWLRVLRSCDCWGKLGEKESEVSSNGSLSERMNVY